VNRFLKYKIDHILFWALTIFFHGYTRIALLQKTGLWQFLLELIVRNVLLAGVIYLALWRIIPQFTSGKRIIQSLLLLIGTLVSYVVLKNAHDVYLFGYIIGDQERAGFFDNSLYNFSIVVFYLAFASALHMSKQWFLQQELIRKIELEKVNTELEYLRAQINPHFLFNSINTIYFQIDKQNEAARETLGKFSDMLRYQLYECSGHTIEIEKEVIYLKNYIALQQLRKGENYFVDFTANDLTGFNLPPLLLIPFVENAFKHVSTFPDKKNEIRISLLKASDTFKMDVFNTIGEIQGVIPEASGIGMKNVMRRLELLFKDDYKLSVSKTGESYSVILEFPIL
jgi:two-component system, LytTR family, sensor kinase